jgi:hypothetical protein
MTYVLPIPALGYEAGTALRDVTLAEARSWACNRCGDCCDGSRDHVTKDEATGLPRFVWSEETGLPEPQDFYASRYGQPLLQPLVMADGGLEVGSAWERDADDMPFRAFRCSFLRADSPDHTTCMLRARYPDPSPRRPEQNRPLHCGEFPVFGSLIDLAIRDHGTYIPATGALPRCTWHGIRIVRQED